MPPTAIPQNAVKELVIPALNVEETAFRAISFVEALEEYGSRLFSPIVIVVPIPEPAAPPAIVPNIDAGDLVQTLRH